MNNDYILIFIANHKYAGKLKLNITEINGLFNLFYLSLQQF